LYGAASEKFYDNFWRTRLRLDDRATAFAVSDEQQFCEATDLPSLAHLA